MGGESGRCLKCRGGVLLVGFLFICSIFVDSLFASAVVRNRVRKGGPFKSHQCVVESLFLSLFLSFLLYLYNVVVAPSY